MDFQVEKLHPTVTVITMRPTDRSWDQWFLLRSDAHHDNLLNCRELETLHLEQAVERRAGILDFGDLFCAMQGKWDKRADLTQCRPEHQVPRYLDALVDTAAEYYGPYAANWALLGLGNHETSIVDHHQTSLTERLAERLRSKGSPVVVGTMRGWVVFRFEYQTTHRQSYTLHYHHGYGGGGPVTRDTIQSNRQMVYTDADILASGHTHDAWSMPIRRERLLHNYAPESRDVEVIKCGGYKDEFTSGTGFATRQGRGPKPLGAYWLRFRFSRPAKGRSDITFDVVRAHEE